MTRRGGSASRWDHLLAGAVGAVTLAALLATAGDLGFARDEGFYYRAAIAYQGWFDVLFEEPGRAFEQEVIDQHWRHNREHPALMKTLFGLSWRLFHQRLGWLPPSTAVRLPGMVMAALCVYLTALLGCRLYGRLPGLAAGLLLAAQPRFFYHGHLACFDVAMAAAWLATTYAYLKAQDSKRWAVVAGLAFGLALCTKLNAFFIPPVLALHHLIMLVMERRRGLYTRPVLPLSFVMMAILGPALFFAHWPWIWHETVDRVGFYLAFHRAHAHYNMEYFGVTYFRPPVPVSFPFVMTAITVPVTTLLLAALGLIGRTALSIPGRLMARLSLPGPRGLPAAEKGADLLVVLCLLWPILIIAWPTVPIFGGTKHWLPAMPMLALVAGVGLGRVASGVRRLVGGSAPLRVAAAFAASLLLCAPAVRETAASHPFGLTHYNVLVGGAPGAAEAGMNRQFWGYTTGSAIDWLNERVPPGGRVFFHDTAHDSYRMYVDDESLRRDVLWGATDSSFAAMVHHEQHMAHVEYEIWERLGTTVPAHVVYHEGVPVLSIYTRPEEGTEGGGP